MKLINQINPLNISKIFFLLFLISLFFPVHYTFFGTSSIETGIYSDFTTITLYLSDILLIFSFVFLLFANYKAFYCSIKPLFWLILWVFVVFVLNYDKNWGYSLFFSFKFVELVVAYGTVATLAKQNNLKTLFLSAFICLSSIQSIIALAQFYFQRPLGLFKIGEEKIYSSSFNIARIILDGHAFVRGYGTFPHPNPLSAFLIVGTLVTIYLLIKSEKNWQKWLYSTAILINTLGITVTFSRGAYFALATALVLLFSYLFYKKAVKTLLIYKTCGMVLFSILVSIVIFYPYLLTRTTITDQAVVQRGVYNNTAINIIKDKPFFGLGPGLSVLHMQQYSKIKLWPWQIQPIHNYFLLATAELGIPGLLILCWIFLSHLKKLMPNTRYQISNSVPDLTTYNLLLTTIFVSFLILMMFDHYFYTLEQTQMLLWILLGAIAAETKTPYKGV